MKKFAAALIFLLAASAARAQFIGYVGLQTTYTRVINASTTTGRTLVNTNIGASFHTFTYCASSSTGTLQLFIEESPDGASNHFTQISATYGLPNNAVNGNECAVIRVGGYYSVLAVNVVVLTGGNLSVWYSATAGPADLYPPSVNTEGGASAVQCDQRTTLDNLVPGNYQVVVGKQFQSIYVCGGTLSFNAAPTAGEIYLLWGTTATCGGLASGSILYDTYIIPTSPTPFAISSAGNSFFRAPASVVLPVNNLCLLVTGVTASTAITLNWAQF
jgi:hypothetical protein